jgi:hypothetical protein
MHSNSNRIRPLSVSYNNKVSPADQTTVTSRDAEEPIKDDLYAPLTARTLANRNRRIFTLEDRVEHLQYSYSPDHQPKFTRLGCLTRVLYRILSLDSRLTIKIRFLFSFVGSLFVTFGTTLAFMFKDLELKSIEKKGLEPGNEDGWKAFYFTFAMVIVGLATLTSLEIFYYIYKVTFYRPPDIYREMRFEQAFSYYWDNNPFMRDLSNEYCATQGQDPDDVLMYLLHEMDKEERTNISASNSKRFAAYLAKFLLLHVKIKS